ncbi:SRPBCC domain-containing protein [Bdellovibrio sp. HCB209]|uniref:SRPBCC domain-containing protein n=1 Tax=Bdellovibrio sp. HCB209 TaxID=3394354 RepID=UPI0039B54FC5
MTIPKFECWIIIQKPVREVFSGVYDNKKISAYFTTAGASAPLKEGSTVLWEFADFPGPFPVTSKKVIDDKLIIFEWGNPDGKGENTVEFHFEALNTGETKVKVYETGWKDNEENVKLSYGNCMGWSQMISALKCYLEYGINLRKGAYKPLAGG